MAKLVQILFVGLLIIVLCSAEVPRSRNSLFQARRNRYLARQEAAEPAAEPAAVTPYPTADELKPEVPFDEAEAADEKQSSQPDEVYGPPEGKTPVETNDAAAAAEEQSVAEEEPAAEEESAASARLTARRASLVRKSPVRSAKLRKAAPARL